MTPAHRNSLLSHRRFWRYVVDGDEILLQHFGVHLDGEPHFPWVALLNREGRFEDSARWRAFELARLSSGKVPVPRTREEMVDRLRREAMDSEMRRGLTNFWLGADVPEDIDETFGGLTMVAWSGPRTLRECLEAEYLTM
jgi:hypothetical protein